MTVTWALNCNSNTLCLTRNSRYHIYSYIKPCPEIYIILSYYFSKICPQVIYAALHKLTFICTESMNISNIPLFYCLCDAALQCIVSFKKSSSLKLDVSFLVGFRSSGLRRNLLRNIVRLKIKNPADTLYFVR